MRTDVVSNVQMCKALEVKFFKNQNYSRDVYEHTVFKSNQIAIKKLSL